MRKKHYQKELTIKKTLQKGSRGKDVRKVQEWLNLWRYVDSSNWRHAVTIDGDFGPQTESVLKAFQEYQNLPISGKVTQDAFAALSAPMDRAFKFVTDTADLRSLITTFAEQHLQNSPTELNSRNEGPWVRAYMDGHDGPEFPWCVGFVQTILDQAFSVLNLNFETVMQRTYSCDVVAELGLRNNTLIRNRKLRQEPQMVKTGDVFLVVNTPRDWTHTGIVVGIEGDWLHTIEGNTNAGGSREGIEVRRRMRNYMKSNIDVFTIN